MRKNLTLIFILAAVVFLPYRLFGQHEMVIEDYTTNQLYLNDEILGDSTSAGTRNDPDRVYVLKRGGTYLVDAEIRNTDWVLRIKAEDGTGQKPTIYTFKNPDNATYPSYMFNVQGDIWLKNLNLVGWTEFLPADIADMPNRILEVRADGPSVYIDSCVLSGSRAATIQTTNAAHLVKITNTIMAQSGNLFKTNIGNGRHIDFRTNSCDSVIIQNCSMTDNTDRIIRHYASTASLGYFLFDHNTVVNALSMHGDLGLGYVGNMIQITNNVLVDNFVLGNDSTDDVRLSEFGDPAELDQFGNNRMTMVGCVPNDTTQWIVKNNYYSVTDSIQAFYDEHADIGLGNLIPLTWHINKKIADSTTAFIKEAINLAHTTHSLRKFAEWYWTPDPNGPGKSKNTTNFSSDVDYQRPPVAFYSDLSKFDLSYGTTASAYTGADGGLPAGDLNWYPDKKVIWSDVKKIDKVSPDNFALEQNYPNPFNPSTKIVYSISKQSKVTLDVYDILGRHVASLVNQVQPSGQYIVDFNASKLSSGVYVYKLSAGDQIFSKKMMLIK